MNKNGYIETDCPVCGRFHFSELDDSDAEMYEYVECPYCGWRNDKRQIEDPHFLGSINKYSLVEYKQQYLEKITDNPEYIFRDDEYVPEKHQCPVCNKHTFSDIGSFEICPKCGWVDDELMENYPDDWEGCSNDLCLNEYRKRFMQLKKMNPKYRYDKDGLTKK